LILNCQIAIGQIAIGMTVRGSAVWLYR
jgi:hypothetical protein